MLGERVVARHRMLLAAFLMQPDRPCCAARPEVLDFHRQRRVDPRKRIGEGRDQCAITQIAEWRGRDTVDEPAPFGSSTGAAGFHDVLGPRTAAAGLIGKIWPVTSQSKSIRSLTPGVEFSCCRPRPQHRIAGSS